jgi:hypothetical protein
MEFIKWLVTSSADPTKYSLMVKGVLSMWAAWVIQALPITCGLHLICVDQTVLMSAVETMGNIVYLGLSLIGAVYFLWGLGRKIWLNRISAYELPPSNLPTA